MIIKSPKNPVFKKLVNLTKSRGVDEQSRALVSGGKITKEIAKLSPPDSFWIMTEDMMSFYEGFDKDQAFTEKSRSVTLPSEIRGKTVYLSKELFCRLDVCGTKKPLLCCQYDKPKSFLDLNSNLATLYVAISDPGNLGALVRSLVAFCWPQIVLLSEAAHPFLPKAVRGSSGAVFKASFFSGPSIGDLSAPDIVALDKRGKTFDKKELKKDLKLLVGEEGRGIPESFKGRRLSIPTSSGVESLNTTVAASLIVYEWSQMGFMALHEKETLTGGKK